LASEAGRSVGMRLTAEQWGQTTWVNSVMGARPSMALADIWPLKASFQALKDRDAQVRSRIRDINPR
jgi:hypothetical protein